MNRNEILDEILDLIELLESEGAPKSLSEAMRLKADALTVRTWLFQEVGRKAPVWIEKRAERILNKANEEIGRWTAKPRLCLNA